MKHFTDYTLAEQAEIIADHMKAHPQDWDYMYEFAQQHEDEPAYKMWEYVAKCIQLQRPECVTWRKI